MKKIWKWVGFLTSIFAVTAVIIATPFIASTAFFENYRKQHSDEYESLKYQIPKNLGTAVADSAFAYGENADRISPLPGDNKKFQDAIENTWLFAGGNDFFSDWDYNKNFKNVVGLFEENIRWTMTSRGGPNPTAPYSSLGRFCINISKPNQTLKEINDNYDFKVKNLDPKNVVVIVGSEYAETDNIDQSLNQFENDLRTFVNKALQLRNNTSNLIFMKHWKIPNPSNDETIAKYNDNISKLNTRANRILSELNEKQIPRVVLVDNENLFLDLQYHDFYEYVNPDYTLTRIGSNEVAKSILKTIKPWNSVTNAEWTTANWTDYSKTHLNVVPVDWSILNSKNDLMVNVDKVTIENNVATFVISFPNGGVNNGDLVEWMFEYTNLGDDKGTVYVKDSAVVNNNQITIENIFVYTSDLYSSSSQTSTVDNSYCLTIFDANQNVFDRVYGNLNEVNSNNLNNNQSTQDSDAKTRFIEKFNDKSKPLVWTFLGDSIDHGAFYNQGFDCFPEAVQKCVANDWKRYDDIFINAAQSGNFTNRAVDPYLIQADITKYKADVVSIGLGISDGVSNTANGQPTFTTKEQFQTNIKTLINAAISANPEVVVVVNAINPTQYSGRQNIPTTYNAYLKEMFETTDGSESEFKNNVIYNENVYTMLNMYETNYTYTINDQLFLGSDKLHPSGNANTVKALTFLQSLGVEVDNSYISDYMLQQFVWWTTQGSDQKPIQPIGIDKTSSSNNKISPDVNTWSSKFPIGGNANNNNLANIFITYSNQTDGREYLLLTDYAKFSNNYRVMLGDGEYIVSAWGCSKAPLSSSAQYGCLAPDGNITVSKQTTTYS